MSLMLIICPGIAQAVNGYFQDEILDAKGLHPSAQFSAPVACMHHDAEWHPVLHKLRYCPESALAGLTATKKVTCVGNISSGSPNSTRCNSASIEQPHPGETQYAGSTW